MRQEKAEAFKAHNLEIPAMIVGRVEARADVDRFSHRRSRRFGCFRFLNPASPEVLHRQGCCMCVVLPPQSQVKILQAVSQLLKELVLQNFWVSKPLTQSVLQPQRPRLICIIRKFKPTGMVCLAQVIFIGNEGL